MFEKIGLTPHGYAGLSLPDDFGGASVMGAMDDHCNPVPIVEPVVPPTTGGNSGGGEENETPATPAPVAPPRNEGDDGIVIGGEDTADDDSNVDTTADGADAGMGETDGDEPKTGGGESNEDTDKPHKHNKQVITDKTVADNDGASVPEEKKTVNDQKKEDSVVGEKTELPVEIVENHITVDRDKVREKQLFSEPTFGKSTVMTESSAKGAAQMWVAITQPISSLIIGFPHENGTNLSSTAQNYAKNLKDAGVLSMTKYYRSSETTEMSKTDEGSERGAFRHVLWQALITSKLSARTATRIANAHENNRKMDELRPPFATMADADTYADQLNNVIGRDIGKNNRFAGRKKLAGLTLDEFYNNGLYTVFQNEDDSFDVHLTTLSEEAYNKGVLELDTLNRFGSKRR